VRLAQCLTHEIGVAVEINDRCFVHHARRLARLRDQRTRIAQKVTAKSMLTHRVIPAMAEIFC
jgi:hypothetical protein